ncbi:MAG: hypothetical protein HOP23_15285 [Methylococcaceae bacterium]|nr:hypothetical protein [Methylococcaceae bacterium]
MIDWNYNEDRCRIRTGHGPANITRLRRFVVGLIKFKGADCVAKNTRLGSQHTAGFRLPQDDETFLLCRLLMTRVGEQIYRMSWMGRMAHRFIIAL